MEAAANLPPLPVPYPTIALALIAIIRLGRRRHLVRAAYDEAQRLLPMAEQIRMVHESGIHPIVHGIDVRSLRRSILLHPVIAGAGSVGPGLDVHIVRSCRGPVKAGALTVIILPGRAQPLRQRSRRRYVPRDDCPSHFLTVYICFIEEWTNGERYLNSLLRIIQGLKLTLNRVSAKLMHDLCQRIRPFKRHTRFAKGRIRQGNARTTNVQWPLNRNSDL